MTALLAGRTTTVIVPPGGQLKIKSQEGAAGTVVPILDGGAPGTPVLVTSNDQTFGPYVAITRWRLFATLGQFDYEVTENRDVLLQGGSASGVIETNNKRTVFIPVGQTMRIGNVVSKGSLVRLSVSGGEPSPPVPINGSELVIGPFTVYATFRVECTQGPLPYSIGYQLETNLYANTYFFSTDVTPGQLIATFNDPWAGRGFGTTTYEAIGVIPPQLTVTTDGRVLKGLTAAVASTQYSVTVEATAGNGLKINGTFVFTATVGSEEFLTLTEGGGWPIGRGTYPDWYRQAYDAPATFEAVLLELGLTAGDVIDARNYMNLDLAVAAAHDAQKFLIVGSGNYTVSTTRKYGPPQIYGYGGDIPFIGSTGSRSTASLVNGSVVQSVANRGPTWYTLGKHDWVASYVRFGPGHHIVNGCVRPSLPLYRPDAVPPAVAVTPYYTSTDPLTTRLFRTSNGSTYYAEQFPSLRVGKITVLTGGTGSITSIGTLRQLEGTNYGHLADDAQDAARNDPNSPNLITNAINYVSKTAAQIATMIAAEITSTGAEGVYAEVFNGNEVRIFKPTFRGDFKRLIIVSTGSATFSHDTNGPSFFYRACQFKDVDCVGAAMMDVTGMGAIRWAECELDGTWGGFYAWTSRWSEMRSTNTYWHDCTGDRCQPRDKFNYCNQFAQLRMNSPVHRREQKFYGTIIDCKYDEILDVHTLQDVDTATGGCFIDARGIDREYLHNEIAFFKFVRLKGLRGGEDVQPIYGKSSGGWNIHDGYMEDCGAGYQTGDPFDDDGSVRNGSEFCAMGLKDDPDTYDASKRNVVYNMKFVNMPSGIPILKHDNQPVTWENFNILVQGYRNYRGDTLMTDPRMTGAIRVTEKVGPVKVHSILYLDTVGLENGFAYNFHNMDHNVATLDSMWEISNIVMRNTGAPGFPEFTPGDKPFVRINDPPNNSAFFGVNGAYFGHSEIQNAAREKIGNVLIRNVDNGQNLLGTRQAELKPYVPPAVATEYEILGDGVGTVLGDGKGKALGDV